MATKTTTKKQDKAFKKVCESLAAFHNSPNKTQETGYEGWDAEDFYRMLW